ncbi:MAG: Na+ dependent nucleoside transporter N-terminal domain-containing protein [Opitutaceae bacterium]|nr:Na+ dependent nucleoside transporter N-terminal domain-containing protein [Opitutaceae bacterium]
MESLLHAFRGLSGIAALLFLVWLLSDNSRAISWRIVAAGVTLQFVFASLVLYFTPARVAIEWVGGRFVDLLAFTQAGSMFMFGSLADQSKHGAVFAISILPSIIFFSAFSSLLYYLGILQKACTPSPGAYRRP